MNKLNLSAVPVEEWKSPKGRYRGVSQRISQSMRQNNGAKHGGPAHPFDVQLVRLPPRAANSPYHSHSAQWEFFLVLAGRGQMRTPGGRTDVREGDCLQIPPGEAHQLVNTGAVDLIYYLIADNPPSNVRYYPDSNKWALPGVAKTVRLQPTEYYGEEE